MEIQRAVSSLSIIFLFTVFVTACGGGGGGDKNSDPVIAQTGPLAVTMNENETPVAFVAPVITATDADGDSLAWSGSAASNGTASVSGTGASPTVSYTPNANFTGSDSFDVTVSDGNGGSAMITIEVTVDPTPVAAVWDQFDWDDGGTWQ